MSRIALALVLGAALTAPAAAAPINGQLVGGTVANPDASGLLTYRGGPILAHVKVQTVYWGSNVQFSGTGTQSLDAFYKSVVQSQHYDWLTEYKTTNQPVLGRGSFIGSYAYTNGATGTVTDTSIQSALGTLIDGGKLPKPDADTLYAIHFAPGIKITQNGQASCQVFCAYHGSFSHGGSKVFYSVVPDQGGSCAGGCGNDPSLFNNTTSVASHELVEATTDPDVGENVLSWYNDSQGEIGDICNGQQCKPGTLTACPGSYTVQLEYSNKNNTCIAVDPTVVVNDFSVALSPTTVTVPVGGMTTVALTLTKTAGNADNVKLSASAATNLTTSFSPTSATSAGGTSMVTFAASPTAMAGTMATVTVTAAGTTSSHTVDVPVMITAPPDMSMQPDLAEPNNGGNGGSGGGGSGGSGNGTGGNGTGNGGSGGNGNNGGGGTDTGCSMGGGSIAGSWAFAGLILLALAFRRRRA
jgi:MYXO-CTERM domain-containing protein